MINKIIIKKLKKLIILISKDHLQDLKKILKL
jgi:hypothetical protein